MTTTQYSRMQMVGLGPDEIREIIKAGELLSPHYDKIVDAFYGRMVTYEPLTAIIATHTTTDRLKKTFQTYLTGLFSGRYDHDYRAQRIQVGLTHDRVGLPLKWYLGMFGHLQELIFDELMPHYLDQPLSKWRVVGHAIETLIRFDQLLAVDAYVDAYTAQLRMEKDASDAARKTKSMFLATVSHELRTPLVSILGFTDLIMDHSNEITPQTRQHLQVLHRNATNLLNMINGLIEVGQADSGKWKSTPVRGSLQSLMEDMATNAEGLLAGKSVKVHRAFSGKHSPEIVFDFSKLRQIILNIVSNACKFTDEGEITLDCEQSPRSITITISDTGPGIPADQVDQIFVEFYRVKNDQPQKPGHGLGLAIVKTLISSLGGTVTVSPVKPHGTSFTVKLPLAAT